jgi:carbon starvation protein
MTIPIAMIVGIYLRYIKPGGVLFASLFGVVMFLLAVYGGKIVHYDETLGALFNKDAKFLAIAIMLYGFAAATLPVWLLLTPRDYLSSFLKLGTIFLLAIALFVFHPDIQMPALTQFIDGSGPVFSGKIFPFLFITIACGAISGFHALVASGTTPKIISDERDVRLVGYGSMLLEGCVAIMAMIAACVLDPGIFFAINSSPAATGVDATATITSWGFAINNETMANLASQMGEHSLFARTGGAPSLAVGMANIFSSAFGSSMLSMWYHFAIMFEAVFILTTLDAGTRVARFMLEDLVRQLCNNKAFEHLRKNAGAFHKLGYFFKTNISSMLSSFVIVSAWGYFLYLGVTDPNGGINILWPLFGMSNQMLAGIALSLATVMIAKSEKRKFFFITAIPLAFVVTTTSWAALEKVFSDDVRIGFLAMADSLTLKLNSGLIAEDKIEATKRMIFNQKLVSVVAMVFVSLLWIVVIDSCRIMIEALKPSLKKRVA